MAIDKKLQIFDNEGNPVDYDILASDVKFLPDGKDLPTKLAEMEEEIDDAGQGDGTVTGVKVNGTTHDPNDQGVVDIGTVITQHQDISGLATKTELAGKVDKNGTDSLMTAAEHTKLAGIAAGAQVNAVNGIKVNGTLQTPDTEGNVDISVEGAAGQDGITPHIGSNGNWWIGPETDQNNDTGTKAQGPAGSVTITDGDIDTLEVHNALNAYTGLLGMSGAMRIKSNIDSLYASLNRLYGKLANMAFWDSEDQEDAVPTPVDWSIPQITVTLDKTSLSANAMITDASDQEITGTSVSVDEGSGLTLKIKPRTGYALTAAPSATIGGVSQTLTESNGVYTLVIDSVTEAITIVISATAAQARSVETILTGCSKVSGPTSIINGGGGTFVFAANEDYTLPTVAPTVSGATVSSWNSSTGELVIGSVTGDVTITVVAVFSGWYVAPKNDTSSVFGVQFGATIIHTGGYAGNVIKDANVATILCPRCNNSNPSANGGSPAGDSQKNFYQANGTTFQLKMKPLDSGCYALNVASYANDYSFISRDSYKDVGANENWETSFNLPANAVHIKVFVCRRDNYGGSVLEIQSVYDNWDNTTMKYK